jgi:hypothetical protein
MMEGASPPVSAAESVQLRFDSNSNSIQMMSESGTTGGAFYMWDPSDDMAGTSEGAKHIDMALYKTQGQEPEHSRGLLFLGRGGKVVIVMSEPGETRPEQVGGGFSEGVNMYVMTKSSASQPDAVWPWPVVAQRQAPQAAQPTLQQQQQQQQQGPDNYAQRPQRPQIESVPNMAQGAYQRQPQQQSQSAITAGDEPLAQHPPRQAPPSVPSSFAQGVVHSQGTPPSLETSPDTKEPVEGYTSGKVAASGATKSDSAGPVGTYDDEEEEEGHEHGGDEDTASYLPSQTAQGSQEPNSGTVNAGREGSPGSTQASRPADAPAEAGAAPSGKKSGAGTKSKEEELDQQILSACACCIGDEKVSFLQLPMFASWFQFVTEQAQLSVR